MGIYIVFLIKKKIICCFYLQLCLQQEELSNIFFMKIIERCVMRSVIIFEWVEGTQIFITLCELLISFLNWLHIKGLYSLFINGIELNSIRKWVGDKLRGTIVTRSLLRKKGWNSLYMFKDGRTFNTHWVWWLLNYRRSIVSDNKISLNSLQLLVRNWTK